MRQLLTLAALVTASIALSAQTPARTTTLAGLDPATIGRIRTEATRSSQAVDHIWWLSEVYGPRPTGSPAFQQASEWAMKRFSDWGLSNVHQERFPFGQGWTIERFSAHLVAPQTQAFIGAPRWYSPSTDGPVLADVVHVDARSEADLAKYAGQLRGKIAVMQPARRVRLLDGRIVLRMGDQEWDEAMRTPIEPASGGGPGQAFRNAQAFQQAVQTFLVAEGAAVLLERGSDNDETPGGSDLPWMQQRVDGGTVFPTNGGSRDPDAPKPVRRRPRFAAAHRQLRPCGFVDRARADGSEHPDPVPSRDGPGRQRHQHDRGDPGHRPPSVVILGAHFDSHPYAGGATDNATGSSAMMEAVRASSVPSA
ncbi:MAG: M28 family peptidase [Vicinamibacterales bacterium]